MRKTTALQVHQPLCQFLRCPFTNTTWNDQILGLPENGNGKAITFYCLCVDSDAVASTNEEIVIRCRKTMFFCHLFVFWIIRVFKRIYSKTFR